MMKYADRRRKPDRSTLIEKTAAEVDVLIPDWIEPLIESSQPLPVTPAKQKTGTCRLLDRLWLQRIEVQTAVPPVDRICRPDSVYP